MAVATARPGDLGSVGRDEDSLEHRGTSAGGGAIFALVAAARHRRGDRGLSRARSAAPGRPTIRSTSRDRAASRRRPACSIASRLWQAVTPEPQEWITSPGARSPSRASNSRAQQAGRLEQASAVEVVDVWKRLSAPGMWPATASIGSTLAAKALAAARVEHGLCAAAVPRRRRRRRSAPARAARGRAAAAVGARRLGRSSAPPVRCQAGEPPSSTATSAWPSQRSIHQRRAA